MAVKRSPQNGTCGFLEESEQLWVIGNAMQEMERERGLQ